MTEENKFRGMTALVTGASRGIGAETALALASRGAFTLVHFNTGDQQAAGVLERIRQAGGDGALMQSDLSGSNGIYHFIELVRQTARPIDILVNNAGSLIQRTRFLDFTEELWDRVFTLNLTSAFLITQAVLPEMIKRGRGVVVNVSSVAARFGGGLGAIAYSSAKGSLSVMTKGLAREFAPHGVRINAVSPGTIDTDYHRTFSTPAGLEAVAKATPMGRIGTSAETADVIVFLCSDAARFIQGQVIEVNGGFLMV
jgi:NAD(P)-dependent dehydrogenase (short-subunit alcohol dehydrogenase family)